MMRLLTALSHSFFRSNLIRGYNCTIRAGCEHRQPNPAYEKGKRPLAWGKLRPFQGRKKIRHFRAQISNCFNIHFVCRKGLLAYSMYIECLVLPRNTSLIWYSLHECLFCICTKKWRVPDK